MQKTLTRFVNVLDGRPSGTRGQSMVELALTAPMLILMIIAMAEVGFAANNFLILGDVVRSAGRQAVNMSVTTWPYNEARNWQRMDCNDTTLNPPQNQPGIFTLYGNNVTVADQRVDPRGSFLPNYFDGNEATKGFFDELACAITNGMSPLVFDDGITGANTVTNPNPKDDIVISVVNYRRMSLDNTLDLGGGTVGSTLSNIGSYGNAWVRVTGRWPLENRYCTNGGLGDNRDPFNYKTSDIRSGWTDGGANDGDEGAGTDATDASPPQPIIVTSSQSVRGYVFTGRAVAPDGCYGSSFTVQDVEARLNITGSTFNPKAANGAVVIIEIYWQHHPAVFGPIFQGFTGNRADDPVLHVWAWFPVPNAEPTPTPKP